MANEKYWEISDHYDGQRFHNPQPSKQGFKRFANWMLHRDPGPWREETLNNATAIPVRRSDEWLLTWVGHSTVLLQLNGWNILTDPIWSERASPVSFAGPRRRQNPGVRFEDLPPIDAVLISHDHYDHMDAPTLKRLAHVHDPQFITGLGNRERLRNMGISRCVELDWWQNLQLSSNMQVTGLPARHFSGRSLWDHGSTLWMGFMIQSRGGNLYFAGDTGFGQHFQQIAERFRPIRTALLPIGAFRPEWFMREVHCSPIEAFEAHTILDACMSMAIHFGTFPLGDDGQDEAPERLRDVLRHNSLNDTEVWIPRVGETRPAPELTLPDEILVGQEVGFE